MEATLYHIKATSGFVNKNIVEKDSTRQSDRARDFFNLLRK